MIHKVKTVRIVRAVFFVAKVTIGTFTEKIF